MRPTRLEIEGLRSFRTRQEIPFAGRDYIAVIGDTGAGKSSILEALTFALFGRTTFSGQGHQELMNASSTALRVVLAFDVHGEHWEVTRTLRRAATGMVSTGDTSLRRFDDGGTLLESFDKARVVTAKVESILGLEAEAFLRTVVLPQGQFSRLLVDDDQRLRASVLRQIWRTDELTDAGVVASEALADLAPLRGRCEQALAGEPDDPEARLAALQAEVDRCTTLLDIARRRRGEASEAAAAVVEAGNQVARANQLADRISGWDDPAMTAAAAEIAAAEQRSNDEIAEVHRLLLAARSALGAVPADSDGLNHSEVATFSVLLEALPALAIARHAAADEAADAHGELAALEERLAGATAAAEQAQHALKERRAARTGLAVQADAVAIKCAQGRAALLEARRAATAADAAERHVREAEDAAAERGAEREGTCDELVEARSAHRAAAATLERVRRSASAAAAGHGLHPGDPCPVCARALPPAWEPSAAPELDAARLAVDGAVNDLEAVQERVQRHEAAFQAAEAVVGERRRELRSARDLATSARDGLIEHLPVPSDLTRHDDELLADLQLAIVAATHALSGHDLLIAAAEETSASAGREHAAAKAAHQGKAAELVGALQRAEQAAAGYADQIDRVPEALRPTGNDLQAEVGRALSLLAQRRRLLDWRSADRAQRQGEIDELAERDEELDQARRQQVEAPADRLWNRLLAQRSVLVRGSEDLAEPVALPAVDPRPAVAGLARIVHLVTTATAELLKVAATLRRRAQDSAEAASHVLSRLGADLGLDPSDPDRIINVTATLTEDAALEQRRAAADADAFRRRMPAIASLRAAGAELEERYLALSDLSAALRDGAFPKWLTLRRSRSLLVHASRLLCEITAGRYAFADLDDEVSQWFIFDSDNGQPRSPSSLSGGEKFVASLALALGMVEMMGRQGDRIESLFLDEGFGALDRTNLDAAVEALGSIAATGRMVAVITHLRAVAEQIDNVLSVTREATGSRAVWLSPSARSELAERELTAASGLLE